MKKKMTKEEMEFWNIEPDELDTTEVKLQKASFNRVRRKLTKEEIDFWGMDPDNKDEYVEIQGRLYFISKDKK